MKVGIFGLGRLGLPMLAVYAKAGNQVFGYDKLPHVVACLEQGDLPPGICEPGLAELLKDTRENYAVTTNSRAVVDMAEIIFIVVPTPSEPDGGFSNKYVLEVCRTIGEAMTKDRKQLIVLVSTVMPGACDGVIVPALERYSRLTVEEDFAFCYAPEFVALGSVIDNMLHPDFLLIGCNNVQDRVTLLLFYATVFQSAGMIPLTCGMSCLDAEIAKLSLNAYLTTKIAFANQTAGMCEKIPRADAAVILETIGHDSRIGGKFLKPTGPPSGPCLPRDSSALIRAAEKVGVRMPLSVGTISANAYWPSRMAEMLGTGKTIAILGLTYKPHANVTEGSPAVALASLYKTTPLRIHDPILGVEEMRQLLPGENVTPCATTDECLDGADTVVILTPWECYKELVFRPGVTVIDCWRILNPVKQPKGVKLLYPGRSPTWPT